MATSCPSNPASPDGFKIWRGPVPPVLSQWAVDLRDHWMGTVTYGSTTGMWLPEAPGQPAQYVIARKDHHTWTYRGSQLLTGICIPGITLYKQIPGAALTGVPDGMGQTEADTLETPDINAAVYNRDPGTDWGLVGWSAGAIVVVVVGFVAGMKFAERAAA